MWEWEFLILGPTLCQVSVVAKAQEIGEACYLKWLNRWDLGLEGHPASVNTMVNDQVSYLSTSHCYMYTYIHENSHTHINTHIHEKKNKNALWLYIL